MKVLYLILMQSLQQKYSITFDSPGNYKYCCIYHPSMIGEIIVE
ncbi:MAG: plastocyanin/azurin family copper-binding protein [Candidatus Nitrosocosmicus sp.]